MLIYQFNDDELLFFSRPHAGKVELIHHSSFLFRKCGWPMGVVEWRWKRADEAAKALIMQRSSFCFLSPPLDRSNENTIARLIRTCIDLS